LRLVSSYRPGALRAAAGGEPHPSTRAAFRLRRYRPECVEIDLHRLSQAATRALILGVDGHRAITEDEVAALVEQSAGSPCTRRPSRWSTVAPTRAWAGAISHARGLADIATEAARGTALFSDATELLARSLSADVAGQCRRRRGASSRGERRP
jgi:hypothetical protein